MKFRNVKMGDICEVVTDYVANGSFKSLAENVKYSTDGYARLIRLVDYNNKFKEKDSIWVSQEAYKFLKKSKLEGGEIIITNVGANLGTVFLAPILDYPQTLGPNSIMIKTKENDKYIYYLLSSKYGQNRIKEITSGSAMPKFNKTDFKKIEIQLPEIKYQDKVVRILEKIDKKIELNNQINNNLQELTLTLYKQFIEDNNDAEEVLLEDCVKKIGTGADAIQRAPIVDYDTGIRCIRVGDMTNNRKFYEWGFTKMTDKDFNNYKLDIGDIVITRTAVNGIAYLIEDSMKVVCNNGLIRLKVNENYNPLYIFLTMKTKDFYDYIHRIDSETSVRPNMKVAYLTSYRIKKIPLEKQNQFCDMMIKPMRKKQKEIEHENNNLIQLRDILLPRLMSGEIDLDNIEI